MNGDQMMYANYNPMDMGMSGLEMFHPMPEMAMSQPMMPCIPCMSMPCMESMPQHHPPMQTGVKPLYEINNQLKAALRELMEIDFALIEFNLYLDTHPNDERALAQYNRYSALRPAILRRAEALYGPITPMSPMGYPWTWINEPWPWKIQF